MSFLDSEKDPIILYQKDEIPHMIADTIPNKNPFGGSYTFAASSLINVINVGMKKLLAINWMKK